MRLRIARLPRRCGPPRRIAPGAVAPGAVPFGTVVHSAGQGLALGATALERTAGGTARSATVRGMASPSVRVTDASLLPAIAARPQGAGLLARVCLRTVREWRAARGSTQ